MTPPAPNSSLSSFALSNGDEDQATWSWRQTLIGSLLTLVPLLLLNIANLFASNNAIASSGGVTISTVPDAQIALSTLISVAILEGVFVLAPLFYGSRARAGAGWRALGFRGFNIALGLGAIILAMAASLLAVYLFQVIIDALKISVQTNAEKLQTSLSTMPLTLRATLFGAVFIAPFCEEIFFRGFLLQGLRQIMNAPWAVVVSGVIFAVIHVDLGSFPLLLVLGLLLGMLRVVTRSLWPGIILHTANNGLTAILLLTQLAAK